MFQSVGWGEILVLIAAGLVILGPERLPGAISWTMQSIRKVRDYATGATDQLKSDLGPEFDDLRKPLADLNELRGMTPKSIITKHLLDGDDSVLKTFTDAGSSLRDVAQASVKPVSAPVPTGHTSEAATTDSGATAAPAPSLRKGAPPAAADRATARGNHDVADWDAT